MLEVIKASEGKLNSSLTHPISPPRRYITHQALLIPVKTSLCGKSRAGLLPPPATIPLCVVCVWSACACVFLCECIIRMCVSKIPPCVTNSTSISAGSSQSHFERSATPPQPPLSSPCLKLYPSCNMGNDFN